ncbi:hypothetical protein QVD17_35746 [Tagetes erecta]|uniref:RNA polymerase II transcription factor B subunit 2 n=1 Tax=Tagetes erecta TaxID=13708 RepID=A0AAD8JT87_TARER|nr:hypothetical protein QVD17_35746 [Tagetes erecta]
MDTVASLFAMKHDKLYENAFICKAILRSLPPLVKKYVLQLLYIVLPVTTSSLQDADSDSKNKSAIDRLIELRVFMKVVDRKKETTYLLNPTFQKNLRLHINCGLLPRQPIAAVTFLSLEDLDIYAARQWECFLLHLINSAEAAVTTKSFSCSMMKVVLRIRGILSQRDTEGPRLTKSGFEFLLMDTNAQLWYIIKEYISNSEDRGVDSVDLISFMLELSFLVTGEAYNVNTLDDIQRATLKDLANLGLVKLQQETKDSWFIPTKLATNLSISLSCASPRNEYVMGYIVVATNFKLYAYSASKLHREILSLFARLEYPHPNLIVGFITKDHLDIAFQNGITSDQAIKFLDMQIVLYLQQHAHPRVAERVASVPENVTHQVVGIASKYGLDGTYSFRRRFPIKDDLKHGRRGND